MDSLDDMDQGDGVRRLQASTMSSVDEKDLEIARLREEVAQLRRLASDSSELSSLATVPAAVRSALHGSDFAALRDSLRLHEIVSPTARQAYKWAKAKQTQRPTSATLTLLWGTPPASSIVAAILQRSCRS